MELFLTWVWQGCAVALVAALALRMRPATGAATRYQVWWIALAAILTLPWSGLLPPLTGVPGTATAPVPTAPVSPAADASGLLSITAPPVWFLRLAAVGWLGMVAIRLVGLARAARRLGELRRRCRPMSADRERALTRWMALRATGRRTWLRVSDEATVPSLIGLGRPVILLPRALVDALSADELDHVVVHEHAHAQRWDDWMLLAQSIVRALAGWHPGIRVVTRALDRERERACDDWVIARGGSPRVYALSVTKVAESTLAGLGPALAPGMAGSRGEITRRVERLLDTSSPPALRPSRLVVPAAVGALSIVIVLLNALPPLVTTRPFAATADTGRLVESVAPPAWVGLRAMPAAAVMPARLASGDEDEIQSQLARVSDTSRVARATREVPRGSEAPPALSDPVPRDISASSRPLATRPTSLDPVPLIATHTPAAWWIPVPPLASSPAVPLEANVALLVPGPPRGASPWQKLANGGKTVGRKATEAGQATASAFTRFGSAIGRAFSGGP